MSEIELVVDNFAGDGGVSTGIEEAIGLSVDIAINHTHNAIAMHKGNYPTTRPSCEDVVDNNAKKRIQGKLLKLAIFPHGYFPKGALVLTSKGYKAIESLKASDHVLTHNSRYRKITKVSSTQKDLLSIKGHGHPGIVVSLESHFYTKHRVNVWNNKSRSYHPKYGEVEWKKAIDLGKMDYWSSPTNFPSLAIPEMTRRNNKETAVPIDERLIFLAGIYVGDGSTSLNDRHGELTITYNKDNVKYLHEKVDLWPRTGKRVKNGELSWKESEKETATNLFTNSKALVRWLRENFGHLAPNKEIPAWLLGAKKSYRQAFLKGYCLTDVWAGQTKSKIDIKEAVTVSKKLAFSLKSLILSLGFNPTLYCSMHNTSVIEGRRVKTLPSYKIKWRENIDKNHSQTFISDRLFYSAIKEKKELLKNEVVYNIEVEEDESYIVEGIIVHNCKHFSKAKVETSAQQNFES